MFTDDEKKDLLENAGLLIDELVTLDPMIYIQPYFHDYIVEQVTQLIGKQLDQVYYGAFTCGTSVSSTSVSICDELDTIIDKAMGLFYKYIAPKRSYTTSFIRIKPNIEKMNVKINYLKSVPQPAQRTPEWYDFRSKCLTASNIWKAFISESTKNQLIYEKCQPINVDKYTHVSTETSMHWGNKYEPVSILLYERKYKTLISDFGCIPHKSIPFLAASPDGINTLETTERFGRMLEVKNIVNREIDGNPKMEYWVQMQVQMEVCNLNECDFLETRFVEYESLNEFEIDSYNSLSYSRSKDSKRKGVIIMYFTQEKQPHYEYAPIGLSKQEFEKWEEQNLSNNTHMNWVKNIYWKLDEMSCVLVLRNKLWFAYALPILAELWSTIEMEKINGCQHRAPNKKSRVSKSTDLGSVVRKCYINIEEMMKEDDNDNDNDTMAENISENVKLNETTIKTISISTQTLYHYFKPLHVKCDKV